MNTPSNESNRHITSLIEVYLAGGLNDEEKRAFDAHIAGCAACSAAMEVSRLADTKLVDLFASARLDLAYEDRLIGKLRPSMRKRGLAPRWAGPLLHPMVRRIATGVAAAVVLGSVGYGMQLGAERQQRAEAEADSVFLSVRLSADSVLADSRLGMGLQQEGRTVYYADISTPANKETNEYRSGDTDSDRFKLTKNLSAAHGGRGQEGEKAKDADEKLQQSRQRSLQGNGLVDQFGEKGDKEGLEESRVKLSLLEDKVKGGKPGGVPDGERGANADKPASADHSESEFLRKLSQEEPSSASKTASANGRHFWSEANAFVPAPDDGKKSDSSLGRNKESAGGDQKEQKGKGSGHSLPLGSVDGTPSVALGIVNRDASWSSPFTGEPVPPGKPGAAEPDSGGRTGRQSQLQGVAGGGGAGGGSAGAPGRGPVAGKDGLDLFVKGTEVTNGTISNQLDLLAVPALKAELAFKPGELNDADRAKIPAIALTGGTELRGVTNVRAGTLTLSVPLLQNADKKEEDLKAGRESNKQVDIEVAQRITGTPAVPATPATPPKPAVVIKAPEPGPEELRPIQRMIIRNGEIAFEVDSFDSALMQVSKIAGEESGVISTTDSEKLANGRVRGSVVVRCPPERLDTLVLKLRGIGDLKSQKITANDVTKKYTDIDSQLRAGRAMEERLLAIIKTGGVVKDLLEAEKQLGVWREKIEVLEGEIRYIRSQVALSTLTIDIMERDARGPTAAFETENINTGIESDDVEKSRTAALAAIDQAKGRVIDSDLKKQEGGQLIATIVADVSPDAAGPVIDRLKTLGKVARLDISRKTTTQGGVGPIIPGLKVERKETRFQISIYNLARVAPRQVTTLTLAAADVEATYKAILQQVTAAGGVVTNSQLVRPRADQAVGSIGFQIVAEKADALGVAVRAGSEVMQMQAATSADLENTTESKRGYVVEVKSLAHVPARETTTLQLAAKNVPQTYSRILEAAKAAGGRVMTSQLNEQDANNITASLEFDVPREKWASVEAIMQEGGLIVTRNVVRSADAESTVDSKIRLSFSLIDEVRLSPREVVAAKIASPTVPETFSKLVESARESGARIVNSNLNVSDRMNPVGTLSFAVPRENASKFEAAMKEAGFVASRTVNRQADGPTTVDTKVGYELAVIDELQLRPKETVSAAIAVRSVPDAFPILVQAARDAGARMVGSNLNMNDRVRPTGRINFSVPKENAGKFEAALSKAGLLVSRLVNRVPDGQDSVESKIGFDIFIGDERTLEPRETQTMDVFAPAVTDRYNKLLETLRLVDAQVITSKLSQENKNNIIGKLEFIIKREVRLDVEKALSENADIFNRTVARSQDSQNTVDYKLRYVIEVRDAEQQSPRQKYAMGVESSDLDRSVADIEALAIKLGGRKLDSSRSSAGRGRDLAEVVVDVPMAGAGEIIEAARRQGRVVTTQTNRDDNVPEGSLSRARIKISFASPGSVQTERGFGESIREGVSVGLNGLFAGLRYIITGVLIGGPALLLLWVGWKFVSRIRRRREVGVDGPPTTPDTGAGPTPTPA